MPNPTNIPIPNRRVPTAAGSPGEAPGAGAARAIPLSPHEAKPAAAPINQRLPSARAEAEAGSTMKGEPRCDPRPFVTASGVNRIPEGGGRTSGDLT